MDITIVIITIKDVVVYVTETHLYFITPQDLTEGHQAEKDEAGPQWEISCRSRFHSFLVHFSVYTRQHCLFTNQKQEPNEL